MILICFIQIKLLQRFVVRDTAGTCDHITPHLASLLLLPVHVRSDVEALLMTESTQSHPFIPQISSDLISHPLLSTVILSVPRVVFSSLAPSLWINRLADSLVLLN